MNVNSGILYCLFKILQNLWVFVDIVSVGNLIRLVFSWTISSHYKDMFYQRKNLNGFLLLQYMQELFYLLPPATKLGQGYVFTGVCDSVHGGVPDQVHPPGDQPGTPPRTRYTSQTRYTPPGPGTSPRHRACWEIRSYWNAILFYFVFAVPEMCYKWSSLRMLWELCFV